MAENFKRPYLTKNNLQVADTLSDLLQVLYVCTTLSHHVLSTLTSDHSQKVYNIKKKRAPPH
jgi:hypothetical protein